MISKIAFTLIIVVFLVMATQYALQGSNQFPNSALLQTLSTCGGNCPSGTCDTCFCGNSANYISTSQIASLCAQYSWDQTCCNCIVQAESSGNANAELQNPNPAYKYDVGLFQVDSFNWASCNGGNAPCDPNQNLQCAIQVYSTQGWAGWSTANGCGC